MQVMPKTIASSTTNDTTHSITVNEIVPAEIFGIFSKSTHVGNYIKKYCWAMEQPVYWCMHVKYIISYTCKLFIHYTNKKSDANAN